MIFPGVKSHCGDNFTASDQKQTYGSHNILRLNDLVIKNGYPVDAELVRHATLIVLFQTAYNDKNMIRFLLSHHDLFLSPSTVIFHYVVRAHPRHLRITLVILTFICVLCYVIISLNRTSNVGIDIVSDRSIEAVNIRARTMFGNVAFLDPLLQLLNYTIVPDQSICVGKEFVVVVHIRAEDEMWRNKWRETYGDSLLMQKFMYALIFSVGLPKSPKQQEELRNESRVHGDVLQANYMDTYRNLTLKQLAELRYVVSSCQNVKAVVKLDDDVGWDVKKAAEFINSNLITNEVHCSRRSNHSPIYAPYYKWTVTKQEWSLSKYPTHCAGLVYITSTATIKRMLDVVQLQKFFWIDDVFITGVLTDASNVTVEHFHGIGESRKNMASMRNKDVFFSVYKEHIIYWFLTYNRNVL